MTNTMTIGDFSRATRLSAKALRFYHRVGLLEPSWVDPVNGYRVYSVRQISDALIIGNFRSLDMPVDLIRQVLAADGISARNELIAGHLRRMETQLEQTRTAVSSLRRLLAPLDPPLTVELRSLGATPALVIADTIDLVDLGAWYTEATRELVAAVTSMSAPPAGPRGGIWGTDLFLDERGSAMLFSPVAGLSDFPAPVGRVRAEMLPAVDLAVTTHRGPDATIGLVYAALGEYVVENGLGIDGPIREFYREDPAVAGGEAMTEIGWPICRTGSRG